MCSRYAFVPDSAAWAELLAQAGPIDVQPFLVSPALDFAVRVDSVHALKRTDQPVLW